MKKIGGPKNEVILSGCTTDSGGGGTGQSLHACMREVGGLCIDEESYLIEFYCLHTLQLTLANAMALTIGKGGIEERNAMQAIHSFYDLQEALNFDVWKLLWKHVLFLVLRKLNCVEKTLTTTNQSCT